MARFRFGGDTDSGAMAVSPGGGTVFVTGDSQGGTPDDYATVAYSAAAGRQLWATRYNGPGSGIDDASAVAVSSSEVFVTGFSDGGETGIDYATIAYDAATGRQLWTRRYDGPGNGFDAATALTVSPGGATIFVTGTSKNRTVGSDYATVAYSSAAGRQLWASRYHGPAHNDIPSTVAVSHAGTTVFLTGLSQARTGSDYVTVAYAGEQPGWSCWLTGGSRLADRGQGRGPADRGWDLPARGGAGTASCPAVRNQHE